MMPGGPVATSLDAQRHVLGWDTGPRRNVSGPAYQLVADRGLKGGALEVVVGVGHDEAHVRSTS